MLRNCEMTERQAEFRERMHALISEYADDIGPALGGHEDGRPMSQPALAQWFVAAEWVDLGTPEDHSSDDSAITWLDSGGRMTQTIGLLTVAADMMRGVE